MAGGPRRSGSLGPRRRFRIESIHASSAGWRPEHHADDEENQKDAHDKRERSHVPWMCRLHDAPPPSLSNRIPGQFAISIDAWDGPRVAPRRATPGDTGGPGPAPGVPGRPTGGTERHRAVTGRPRAAPTWHGTTSCCRETTSCWRGTTSPGHRNGSAGGDLPRTRGMATSRPGGRRRPSAGRCRWDRADQ